MYIYTQMCTCTWCVFTVCYTHVLMYINVPHTSVCTSLNWCSYFSNINYTHSSYDLWPVTSVFYCYTDYVVLHPFPQYSSMQYTATVSIGHWNVKFVKYDMLVSVMIFPYCAFMRNTYTCIRTCTWIAHGLNWGAWAACEYWYTRPPSIFVRPPSVYMYMCPPCAPLQHSSRP